MAVANGPCMGGPVEDPHGEERTTSSSTATTHARRSWTSSTNADAGIGEWSAFAATRSSATERNISPAARSTACTATMSSTAIRRTTPA